MTTKAGVGTSHHHNPNVAGREAAEQGLRSVGIAKPDFVFMFASIGYDQHSLLRTVRETTGGAPLSGCSAEGTINGENSDESNCSVVVTVISSDELQWSNGLAKGLEDNARAVGKPIEVLKECLPEHALAEDRDWTRYAISLALSFRAPSYIKDEEYVLRGVPAVRMSDGSITVQTEVQEGTSIWFSSRDKEKHATGFDRVAAQIKEQLEGAQPKLDFQFECLTRGKTMLREQKKLQLLRQFRQSIGPDVPWAGFYTIGEIGPVEKHNDLHLFTSVVLALS